jgi:hypothetical protein
MNPRILNRRTPALAFVIALAVGGVFAVIPALAQVGPYYDYAPGYAPAPGLPWGTIIENSNHSVPFDPSDAAFAYRYGRHYGFCGFTIAGC